MIPQLFILFHVEIQTQNFIKFIYVSFFENFKKLHKIYMTFPKFSN